MVLATTTRSGSSALVAARRGGNVVNNVARSTSKPGSRRQLLLLLVGILFVGVATDVCAGLPVTRAAGTPSGWLAGIAGLGMLALLAEAGGDWLSSNDKATDALWLRALRLLALLCFAGVIAAVTYLLVGAVA
jgi:hypothetical protein